MRRDRPKRWPALVATSALLVAGSLVMGASPAGAARGAVSGTVVNEAEYGFSFTLPVTWKQVPLNGTDVTALLNAATHDDPALANALSGEVSAAASKGMKVFAVGPLSGATLANLNIIVTSSAGAPTGSAFAPAAVVEAKIGLTEIGAGHAKTSIVRNRLGTVAQVTYQLTLKNSPPQFGIQFYALHKSHVDIISVTTSSMSESQAAARVIVNGWHWH